MIPIYVEKGIGYLWNSEHWYILRTQHRICSAFVGSVPSFPRQNDFLGLPIALSSEETALLVEKRICELHEMPAEFCKYEPTEKDKELMEEFLKKVLEQQASALKKRKIEQLSQKIDIIVAGKKKNLINKGMSDANIDKDAMLEEEIKRIQDLDPDHTLVQLPQEMYRNIETSPVGLDVLRPNILEGDGAIKYSIFKDLWEKGYYVTSGSKFGCDYLIYPGDPVQFHASHMVRCVCNQENVFHPKSLVAFGRLSVAVNKYAVFAYRTQCARIAYQTLQWHDSMDS
ncbi:tRNA-splicing endonuclease subunit Sen34 isoform X1 [Bombyx mandarina]|uniref:tRNA-splicing endonuclease subunit Sen34 n=1 Tax=Bombyx mandarina TaxID=7092 RepID=A0A6J2K9N8_BOMMA|nr:tRNA-splicing endonuclease subunit Sen34 isoform X1 [Bombyx mandarina]